MFPRVYEEFERICARRGAGGAVLEIGAVPAETSLLCMTSLDRASEKVGINLDGPHRYRDFTILRGNANAMDCFGDERFDTILCNAVLEHDPFFWKTMAEIERVARPGALIVIGAPGYVRLPLEFLKKPLRLLPRVPLIGRVFAHPSLSWLFLGTVTVEVHDSPGDFYRFSAQAFREVIFAGMREVEVHSVVVPPIIIGSGIKRGAASAGPARKA